MERLLLFIVLIKGQSTPVEVGDFAIPSQSDLTTPVKENISHGNC